MQIVLLLNLVLQCSNFQCSGLIQWLSFWFLYLFCFQTALSALKAELDAREKLLDEREGTSLTEEQLPGAFRFDAEVTKSNENQRHKVVSGSQIGTRHRQVQADVQPSARTNGNHKATATTNSPNPPVQEGGVNVLSIVKVESVGQEDIVSDYVQNRHDSGKSAMN